MNEYRAEYDTRLLYKQKYETEEGVHVDSNMYAVMWAQSKDIVPVTSRLRYTLLYTREGGEIHPIQGLIEQWKGEGWAIIDEFTEAHITFDHEDDFEEHLAEMAKSFLLGIPKGSKVIGTSGPDKEPVEKAVVVPERVTKILSKDNAIPAPIKEDKSPKKTEDKEDTYAKKKVKKTKPKKSEDDSDEDWI